MIESYDLSKIQRQPLDDVLRKLCPARHLSWLYSEVIRPLTKDHPSLAGELPVYAQLKPEKALKKDDTTRILAYILKSEEVAADFYARLPKNTQKALSILTWQKAVSLAALEDQVGTTLADPNPEKNRSYYEPFILQEPYGLILLIRDDNHHYHFYGRREASKKNVTADIPNAVRKAFKKVIPPPPYYHLVPFDDPGPASFVYTPANVMHEIKAAAEFIEQGHVKYNKNESIAKGSIRKFASIITSFDFFDDMYPATDDTENIRPKMLLSILSFAGQSLRKAILSADTVEPLKTLFQSISPAFFVEELLVHLRYSGTFVDYNKNITARLASFLKDFPTDKWVCDANITQYFILRDETPSPFRSMPYNLHARHERWDEDTPPATEFSIISAPLLRGYAFLLATLGMAEIAYSEPNAHYSPFSGLRAVRLTPLGEYILGKRKSVDIEVADVPKSEILLDTNRLIASCKSLDSLTELALKQFMERLSTERFRMTHKSLLGGCGSRKELEERIALFRRVISPKPPPVWEQFFTKTLARIAPLQKESRLVVFKLDTDDEIRKLFTTDPVLRQHCLKVEGYRIAIKQEDIKTVKKRLEQAGCLCPNITPTVKEE